MTDPIPEQEQETDFQFAPDVDVCGALSYDQYEALNRPLYVVRKDARFAGWTEEADVPLVELDLTLFSRVADRIAAGQVQDFDQVLLVNNGVSNGMQAWMRDLVAKLRSAFRNMDAYNQVRVLRSIAGQYVVITPMVLIRSILRGTAQGLDLEEDFDSRGNARHISIGDPVPFSCGPEEPHTAHYIAEQLLQGLADSTIGHGPIKVLDLEAAIRGTA